jgi:hypothetical protein
MWTTWTISYHAIQAKSMAAANLLLLWACLDHKDLWYGLLARASIKSTDVADYLSEWLADLAKDEVKFIAAMGLLRRHYLIEGGLQDLAGYAVHPFIHRWAFHIQDEKQRAMFPWFAVAVVGWAVPETSEKEYTRVERRLLAHAQRCNQWVIR